MRRRRKRVASAPLEALPVPSQPNVRWSMDFVADTIGDGRTFRVLNVVDDFRPEAVAIEVGKSIPGSRVVRVLDRLARTRGLPIVGTDRPLVNREAENPSALIVLRGSAHSRVPRWK